MKYTIILPSAEKGSSMFFKRWPVNRITRIVAILVLMSFAAPLLLSSIFLEFMLGCFLLLVGFCTVIIQAIAMWRERPGRYDLKRLKLILDSEDVDEQEAERYERILAVCHHCGASMSERYSICPSCGTPLGH
jgi:hypothetical protein